MRGADHTSDIVSLGREGRLLISVCKGRCNDHLRIGVAIRVRELDFLTGRSVFCAREPSLAALVYFRLFPDSRRIL